MNLEELMEHALSIALRGRGYVEPNPRVGAIALEDGEIVGEGFHSFYGGPHAEIVALNAAKRCGAAPDTLVVTLEPCSSEPGRAGKKTPPCVDAIIKAGVRKVVIGRPDPDPRHTAKGEARLKENGVEVVTGVLEPKCTSINRPFNRWLHMDVPWTIAKWAMTLDGKTATADGDSKWISGPASRRRVHEVRAHADAVMVGFRTVVNDDPQLTVRDAEGEDPIRIVVDPLAALPLETRLVQTAIETPTWLIVGQGADAKRVDELERRGVVLIHTAIAPDSRDLEFAAAMRALRQRGVRRLLMEGGGKLAADLMEEGLIHQVMAFLAPKVIGGVDASTPVEGVGKSAVIEAWQLQEMFAETIGGDDVLLHAFAT